MSNGVQKEERQQVSSCSFCGKALGKEYFFVCHVCGAKYCYVHMYRHGRAHRVQNTPTIVIK